MGAIEFRFSISADDEYAFVSQPAQQVAQQPEGATIGPVQIVGVEQQRLAARDIGEDLGDGVEEQQTFFVRRELRLLREWTKTRFDLGSEFGKLRCAVAECFAELVVVLLFADPAAKGFDEGKVRRSRFVFVTTAG